MWDVKAYQRTREFGLEHKFYLNYVGCKENSYKNGAIAPFYCFTLTMWDVKII